MLIFYIEKVAQHNVDVKQFSMKFEHVSNLLQRKTQIQSFLLKLFKFWFSFKVNLL